MNALRFLYVELYKTSFIIESIPRPKQDKKLPDILSQEDVLKISDIDSTRKMIHIRGAKVKKDRYTLLSDMVLNMLREYYKIYKPRDYLFEGQGDRKHLSERSIQAVFQRAVKAAGI